ncbi:hypothetical protein C8Q74DRAFT_796022 [Fomes fomentarius]|nr:hypothetical protein C8Q74DRAFT_796022 [Fomes fomentarius]
MWMLFPAGGRARQAECCKSFHAWNMPTMPPAAVSPPGSLTSGHMHIPALTFTVRPQTSPTRAVHTPSPGPTQPDPGRSPGAAVPITTLEGTRSALPCARRPNSLQLRPTSRSQKRPHVQTGTRACLPSLLRTHRVSRTPWSLAASRARWAIHGISLTRCLVHDWAANCQRERIDVGMNKGSCNERAASQSYYRVE